ncbi:hypothetical protein EPYR_02901 [Erwinia pyrifoliae DSM 12163]|nr:hypothetical protein EPYR_02901 [Erwinia pyrifoliae DSM 12163]
MGAAVTDGGQITAPTGRCAIGTEPCFDAEWQPASNAAK